MTTAIPNHSRFARQAVNLATMYSDQTEGADAEDFVIPESFADMSDADLVELHSQAVAHFDSVHGDDVTALDSDALQVLSTLTEGIETLQGEIATRREAASERAEQAAALAARVHGKTEDADAEDATEEPAADADADEADADAEAPAEEAPEAEADTEAPAEQPEPALAASSTKPKGVRVPRKALASRSRASVTQHAANAAPSKVSDLMSAQGEGLGIAPGSPVDFTKLAQGLDNRLRSFSVSQYEVANKRGQHIREQQSLAAIRKPFADTHIVASSDPQHVSDVIKNATDETKLPQGSLVAAGGWCAPSEVRYDLFAELESRDGLLSLPEINLARGGIRWTPGPSFADIFSDITGFSYTEQQDIDGEYAEEDGDPAVGPKPCYKIECPDFDEIRLGVDGLCLTAGLLQSRGYPEIIARTLRGALVAHDHRMNARLIQAIAAGSTEVEMAETQVGAIAPILTAIELQVEHYRYTHRMSRNATLEGVFPFWVRGAIRSDLSRRLGVDLLSVPDSRVDAWFRERGVNPQFVYNWQNVDATSASDFTEWAGELDFLLYAAGTWVRGSNDVITLDNIYDSVLLGNNDYTALFTEEGWAAIKTGHDSRLVSVSLSDPGAVAAAVRIAQDGTEIESDSGN